jgi:hypothetical protein
VEEFSGLILACPLVIDIFVYAVVNAWISDYYYFVQAFLENYIIHARPRILFSRLRLVYCGVVYCYMKNS